MSEWIDPLKQLPANGDQVIALISGRYSPYGMPEDFNTEVTSANFTYCHGWNLSWRGIDRFEVVAWMPLPPIPEVKDE